jgi:predicted tellurium resistance membrane protein TerC
VTVALIAGFVVAVLVAMVSAALRRDFVLEKSILVMLACLLLVAIGARWGGYGQGVHGDAIWLVLVSLAALAAIGAQWLVLAFQRNRQRLVQAGIVTVIFGGMIVAAWMFG